MKANAALQIIFAFFLGLLVVAFIGIGVNTFYPEPSSGWGAAYDNWALITGVILLVCATVVLVVSLLLPAAQAALANGILLGGVFTMLYAVGITFWGDTGVLRFVVVAVALAITIAVGYFRSGAPGPLRRWRPQRVEV